MLKCVVFFFLLPFYPHFFSYTSYGTIRGLHWIFSTVSKQRVSGGSCVGQRRRSAGRAQWSHGHRSDAHGGRLGSRLLQRSPVPFALKTARDNEYGVSESYNTFVVFRLFCTFSSSSIFFLLPEKHVPPSWTANFFSFKLRQVMLLQKMRT